MDASVHLYKKVSVLPGALHQEVLDFINFLLSKKYISARKIDLPKRRKHAKPGCMKGVISKISKDFDKPLEDFKEYMY